MLLQILRRKVSNSCNFSCNTLKFNFVQSYFKSFFTNYSWFCDLFLEFFLFLGQYLAELSVAGKLTNVPFNPLGLYGMLVPWVKLTVAFCLWFEVSPNVGCPKLVGGCFLLKIRTTV
jgi:hypothetical protein